MKKVSDFPKRYYGLHFSPGVVEYPALKKRIYVSPEVAKEMDASFTGKPLFVQHVDDYKIEDLPAESDGVVVRSFYNIYDGNHWVEFLAISDEANEKIQSGWVLSNSHKCQVDNIAGESKNVSYDCAVISSVYHHMGLVEVARYENSVIYTPEQFKAYNDKLKAQLEHLQNSKDEDEIMLFKKEAVKDSDKLKELSVKLPKSGVEKTVMQLINEADDAEQKKDEKKYANESDMVKVGDEEVTVKELIAKILELAKQLEGGSSEEKPAPEAESLENKEDEKDEKKDEKKEEKKDKLDNAKPAPKFASLGLKNASEKGIKVEQAAAPVYTGMQAQLDLGKSKY